MTYVFLAPILIVLFIFQVYWVEAELRVTADCQPIARLA